MTATATATATGPLTTTLTVPAVDRTAGRQLRYEGGSIVLMARVSGTHATWLARRWDGATVTVHCA